MSGVFISYRREDSQALAGRLFDRLAARFGKDRVFRDVDAIPPGARFTQIIAERVSNCEVLVALIGKAWLHSKDAEGRRRLDLPDDFVRAEIAEALAQSRLVIPVLIDDTPMPARAALPREIAALVQHNALQLSDSRFDFDVGRLIAAIIRAGVPADSAHPVASFGENWDAASDFLNADETKQNGSLLKPLIRKYPNLRRVLGWVSVLTFLSGAVATMLGHLDKVKQYLFEWIGPTRLQVLHFGMEAVVSVLFATGYVAACVWIYRRYVLGITRTAQKVLCGAALTAAFVGLTWMTVKAAIPDPPDPRDLLAVESKRWRKDLLGLQNADGGFRYHKSDAVESQVWTSAQILVGILSGKPRLTSEEIQSVRMVFNYFERTRLPEGEGWGYMEYVDWGVTEINAWVALAYAYSLMPENRKTIWSGTTNIGEQRLKENLQLVVGRQLEDGGWAPIVTSNLRFARAYSTVVALWALIEAKRVTNTTEFDQSIQKGIKWLLSRYDQKVGGWVPNPDRKKQLDSFPGLTAHVLYVLTSSGGDFEHLLSAEEYESALSMFSRWLDGEAPPRQKDSLLSRPASQNDRSHDSDRYLPRSKFMVESSTYLWLPWTISLCAKLDSDQQNPKTTKWQQCRRLYERVHEMIRFARDEPFAYVTAETLHAINVYVASR